MKKIIDENKNIEEKSIKRHYQNGDGDEDEVIIFNITKKQLRRLFFETTLRSSNTRLYSWAMQEGYKKEVNGDIIIGETLVLSKKIKDF